MVCWMVSGFPWHTLQHSQGPPQMPPTLDREGQPVRCLHGVGCRGGAYGFPTPREEAVLLGEDSEPQEEWATTPHTPNWLEEASEPDDAIRPGLMVAAPQNAQRLIPLPPSGFARLLAVRSEPPPQRMQTLLLEYPESLTSLSFTQRVIVRNNMTGKLEYHCEARVISRTFLHLTPPYIKGQTQHQPGSQGTNEWVKCS